MAKKAINITLTRILNYTAEIILSIILLIIVCIPLIFAIPMWFQTVLFGISRPELALNPVAWFGMDGAIWVTLLFGLISFGIGYVYILKMKPGAISADIEEAMDSEVPEQDEDIEDIEMAIEQQEEEEAMPLEDQEEEELKDEDVPLEDIEEDSEPDEIEDVLSDDERGDDE